MNRNVILGAVAVILLAVAVYLLWPKGGGTAATNNYGSSGPSSQDMTRIMQQEMNEAQRARMQTGGVPR